MIRSRSRAGRSENWRGSPGPTTRVRGILAPPPRRGAVRGSTAKATAAAHDQREESSLTAAAQSQPAAVGGTSRNGRQGCATGWSWRQVPESRREHETPAAPRPPAGCCTCVTRVLVDDVDPCSASPPGRACALRGTMGVVDTAGGVDVERPRRARATQEPHTRTAGLAVKLRASGLDVRADDVLPQPGRHPPPSTASAGLVSLLSIDRELGERRRALRGGARDVADELPRRDDVHDPASPCRRAPSSGPAPRRDCRGVQVGPHTSPFIPAVRSPGVH